MYESHVSVYFIEYAVIAFDELSAEALVVFSVDKLSRYDMPAKTW